MLQLVHYNNPRTRTTYSRPLPVLSKLSIQLEVVLLISRLSPSRTVGNIGLDATLPRVLDVPNGSVLETFLSQFLSVWILSSSELQNIPLIASLSTAAIAAALPHEKHAFAGKPKSITPAQFNLNYSMQESPNAGDPASTHRQTKATVFVTLTIFLLYLRFHSSNQSGRLTFSFIL